MNKSYNTKTCREERNGLQDLDLINSFLFRALTENPEHAKFIAKLVIERATGQSYKKLPNYIFIWILPADFSLL